MLELVHYTTFSCTSPCPAGLGPLQCLYDPSLLMLGTKADWLGVDCPVWSFLQLQEQLTVTLAKSLLCVGGQFCLRSFWDSHILHPACPWINHRVTWIHLYRARGEIFKTLEVWPGELLWQLVTCLVVLVTFSQTGLIWNLSASLVQRSPEEFWAA